MYEEFFQLRARPFVAAPCAEAYFPGQAIEAARLQLFRAVEREEGTGLVIGAPGTGKSLLLAVLAEQFAASHRVVRLGAGYLNSRRALLQSILHELGGEYRGLDENETRLELIDQLAHDGSPRGLLLVIDEAQTLSLRILDELRLMSNLCRQGQPRVRLVLAGLAGLEERLADPRLAAVQQRVAVRAYLGSWSRGETLDYVRHELARVGGRTEAIFANEALEQVHLATGGLPRLVNQLCDHALWLAYAGGVSRIGRPGIEEAWADLQQLPSPWQHAGPVAEATAETAPGVVEFGSLDDEPDDEPTAAPAAWPKLVHGNALSESVRSLDELDRHLQLLGEDDPQAVSTEPEVEFVFPEPRTSWDEPFAEEEVVLDNYAELEPTVPLRRVPSKEGHELAAKLERVRLWPASLDASPAPPPAGPAPTVDAPIRESVAGIGGTARSVGGAPRELSAELPSQPSPRRGTSIRIPPPADLPPAYAPPAFERAPAPLPATSAVASPRTAAPGAPPPPVTEAATPQPVPSTPAEPRAETKAAKPDFRRLFVKLRQQG